MDLHRLIAPRSIALVGAGAWTDAVVAGNLAVGYSGVVWRVHPTRASTDGTTFYRSVAELPGVPDAAFVAVPNHEAPRVAGALAALGAGGFVCFSAGFSETGTDSGRALTSELLGHAGALPFFGPNCYGFVNFFDRVAMMPDQIVGSHVQRGVALICQSGTIALTLMFNQRSLPVGCLFTVGNQTRVAVEDLIDVLCEDARVTAFGLYLEGIKDTEAFARAVARARAAGKPVAVIKSGRTAAAARTAHSHTGALAGSDEVFDAFCRQSGIARCDTLATLCETLKLLHCGGPLAGRKVMVMGASGGDMAMAADVSRGMDLEFAPLPEARAASLRTLLTDRVTIANPFDIHTYLWFDPPALKRVFTEVLNAGYDAAGFMLDSPPEGQADSAAYDAVVEVFIAAALGTPTRAALIASLPETICPRIRELCLAGGVIPLQGQREALEAISLAADIGTAWGSDSRLQLQRPPASASVALDMYALEEHEGKVALSEFGVPTPRRRLVPVRDAVDAAIALGFPLAMKASGAHLTHKSDVGGVVLNIRTETDARSAASRLATLSDNVLVEEMFTDGVAEVLVGMIVDAQFGQVLVLGAGGVLTEVMSDSVSLLPPWTRSSIEAALRHLALSKLLGGYRGKPAADVDALISTILAVTRFASQNLAQLVEIDVNPVIVRPEGLGAVAVDAMIRLRHLS